MDTSRKRYDPDPKYGYVGITGACQITGWSVSSLYKAVAKGTITHYKPNGRILFKIDELVQWIEKSRVPASDEQ